MFFGFIGSIHLSLGGGVSEGRRGSGNGPGDAPLEDGVDALAVPVGAFFNNPRKVGGGFLPPVVQKGCWLAKRRRAGKKAAGWLQSHPSQPPLFSTTCSIGGGYMVWGNGCPPEAGPDPPPE